MDPKVNLALKKKRELLCGFNKRKRSLRKYINNLKPIDCTLEINQITKCVFLGALLLKPVPQLFDSPILIEELDMKLGNVKVAETNLNYSTTQISTKVNLQTKMDKKENGKGKPHDLRNIPSNIKAEIIKLDGPHKVQKVEINGLTITAINVDKSTSKSNGKTTKTANVINKNNLTISRMSFKAGDQLKETFNDGIKVPKINFKSVESSECLQKPAQNVESVIEAINNQTDDLPSVATYNVKTRFNRMRLKPVEKFKKPNKYLQPNLKHVKEYANKSYSDFDGPSKLKIPKISSVDQSVNKSNEIHTSAKPALEPVTEPKTECKSVIETDTELMKVEETQEVVEEIEGSVTNIKDNKVPKFRFQNVEKVHDLPLFLEPVIQRVDSPQEEPINYSLQDKPQLVDLKSLDTSTNNLQGSETDFEVPSNDTKEISQDAYSSSKTPELLLSDSDDDDTIDQLMFNIMDIKIGPNVFGGNFFDMPPSDIEDDNDFMQFSRQFPVQVEHKNLDQNDASSPLKNYSTKKRNKYLKRTPQCKICSQVFSSYMKLRKHRTLHNGANPYVCLKCGENHSTLELLIAHLRTHEGMLSFCKPVLFSFITVFTTEG